MEINSIFRIIQEGRDFNTILKLIFKEVCKETLELFSLALETLDEVIMEERDKGKLRLVDNRKRSIGLKIGNLNFKRMYYVEEKEIGGEKVKVYHYLLDEMLNIPAFKKIYPDLVYEGVANTGSMAYRKAAEGVGEEYLQNISYTTIWKKVKELGEKKALEEKAEAEKVFSEGKEVKSQGKQIKTLFAESDGVWASLQGNDRKKHGKDKRKKVEVKMFVSYEGWESRYLGSKEYATKNKWCHAGIEDTDEFWEKVSVGVPKRCDL